jgi:hypothetical protein
MAKLTGKIIKSGLHVWAKGYDRATTKFVPVELVLVSGVERTPVSGAKVVYVNKCNQDDRIDYLGGIPEVGMGIYLGDAGIRPYNYDNRATQVFTTKEECEQAIKLWAGRNPNFIYEDDEDV